MGRQRIEVRPGRFYTVNLDDPFPLGRRFWAIVQARLVDDTTSLPIRTPVAVLLDPPHRRLRVTFFADGWMALTGRPADEFPNLGIQPYTVRFTVHATGYQAAVRAPLMPASAGFPNTFQPLNLGDVRLLPI